MSEKGGFIHRVRDILPFAKKESRPLAHEKQPLLDTASFGLRRETLDYIVRSWESPEYAHALRDGAPVYQKLADTYFGLTNEPAKAAVVSTRLASEGKYAAIVSSVIENLGPMIPEEKRVLASDLVALYGLLSAGGLDELYSRYEADLRQRKQPVPADDEARFTAKIALADGFLGQLRKKNKEVAMVSRIKDPITYGIEMEWRDPLNVSVGETHSNDYYDAYAEEGHKAAKAAAFEHAPVAPMLAFTGAYIVKPEGGNHHELATRASASPRTQLRDIATTARLGGFETREGAWGIHETLGGVMLTPEHTEVMDITPMAVAAGYLFEESLFGRSGYRFAEKSTKFTRLEDRSECYFPLHRGRPDYEVTPYGVGTRQVAVERRSLPDFREVDLVDAKGEKIVKEGAYRRLVQESNFSYFAAWGVRAIQRGWGSRTATDRKFAALWTKTLKRWKRLLKEQGIKNPTNEERYVKVFRSTLVTPTEQNYYLRFLGLVSEASMTNPRFKEESRKMMREYSKEAKKILGY